MTSGVWVGNIAASESLTVICNAASSYSNWSLLCSDSSVISRVRDVMDGHAFLHRLKDPGVLGRDAPGLPDMLPVKFDI